MACLPFSNTEGNNYRSKCDFKNRLLFIAVLCTSLRDPVFHSDETNKLGNTCGGVQKILLTYISSRIFCL